MVQRVNYHQFSGNTVTLGAGGSRVVMGADSGNLKIQDSQSNTSVIEAGFGIQGATGTTIISNSSNLALPPSGIDDGSLYFSTNNSTLYAKIGNGWYKVTTVNTSPSISLDVTSATISDHLNLDITYTVTEPEGTPTTVAITDDITDSAVTVTHTTSNNHVRYVFDGSTAQSSKTITFTATDGVSTGVATCSVNAIYTEELHQPSGTTRLLGYTFNGGNSGKVGSYSVTNNGTQTFATSGGTLNGGYWNNPNSSNYYVSSLATANSGRGKTFVAWYKGTQTNSSSSGYSVGVPIFGDTSGGVWMGLGLDNGKLAIAEDGNFHRGTTNAASGNWMCMVWVYKSNDQVLGYINDSSGNMTNEVDTGANMGNTTYNKVPYIGTGYGYGGVSSPTALDAIQIFDNELTQSQIQAIYDKGHS